MSNSGSLPGKAGGLPIINHEGFLSYFFVPFVSFVVKLFGSGPAGLGGDNAYRQKHFLHLHRNDDVVWLCDLQISPDDA